MDIQTKSVKYKTATILIFREKEVMSDTGCPRIWVEMVNKDNVQKVVDKRIKENNLIEFPNSRSSDIKADDGYRLRVDVTGSLKGLPHTPKDYYFITYIPNGENYRVFPVEKKGSMGRPMGYLNFYNDKGKKESVHSLQIDVVTGFGKTYRTDHKQKTVNLQDDGRSTRITSYASITSISNETTGSPVSRKDQPVDNVDDGHARINTYAVNTAIKQKNVNLQDDGRSTGATSYASNTSISNETTETPVSRKYQTVEDVDDGHARIYTHASNTAIKQKNVNLQDDGRSTGATSYASNTSISNEPTGTPTSRRDQTVDSRQMVQSKPSLGPALNDVSLFNMAEMIPKADDCFRLAVNLDMTEEYQAIQAIKSNQTRAQVTFNFLKEWRKEQTNKEAAEETLTKALKGAKLQNVADVFTSAVTKDTKVRQ